MKDEKKLKLEAELGRLIIEKLNPGDTVTISLESSSGNVDSVISMNWLELF